MPTRWIRWKGDYLFVYTHRQHCVGMEEVLAFIAGYFGQNDHTDTFQAPEVLPAQASHHHDNG